MDAQIVLLGAFHQAQYPFRRGCWARHAAAFDAVLRAIVDDLHVKSIAEEANPAVETSAAILANTLGLLYRNLDIPHNIQEGVKIHPREGWDSRNSANKYILAWDIVREYHMYATFLEFVEGCTEPFPALLICGDAHTQGLQALLSEKYQVICKRYDLDEHGIGHST